MAVKGVKKGFTILGIIICLILFLILGTIIYVKMQLGAVDKNNKKEIEVVIPSGSSSTDIAHILKEKDLIKNEFIFKVFLKVKKADSLKATTYQMKKTMNVDEIVQMLEKGNSYNPEQIKITFKEGQRITDYAKLIAEKTSKSYDEVINTINDKNNINELINKYWFLTDAILQDGIYYSLEGYLAPETYYFKNKDVAVTEIIDTMLAQMEKNLEEYRSKIESNINYYMTMASIVELEGTNTTNRKMIVGVFENRLANGMNMGSDVTTYYALQKPMTSDLTTEEFGVSNPYNTRNANMIGKLPLGPICNFSPSSLEASVTPTKNDYLFFVADKNGEIYYSKTNKEHEAVIAEIKEKGDWIW